MGNYLRFMSNLFLFAFNNNTREVYKGGAWTKWRKTIEIPCKWWVRGTGSDSPAMVLYSSLETWRRLEPESLCFGTGVEAHLCVCLPTTSPSSTQGESHELVCQHAF